MHLSWAPRHYLYTLFAALLLSPGPASAQITVSQPATVESIRPAADFATRSMQDPWDMNQRTDLGWYTSSVDQPASNLSGLSFTNGVFSATSANTDPNFWLLDPGNPYAVNTGKIGTKFPIDTTKYKRLLLRMSLSGGPMSSTFPPSTSQTMQILWTNNTLVNGVNVSNSLFVMPGWWIHSIRLDSLGTAAGQAWTAQAADSLRIDPVALSGVALSLDWARLVEEDPSLSRNIAWTGASSADIYLDSDTSAANGFLGQIDRSKSSPYSFYAGGLPLGSYYVAVCPAGSTSGCSYAPGRWNIDDIPTLSFTSPSPSGSSDDFATTQLLNPWDMDALTDIDRFVNVTGLTVAQMALELPSGVQLGQNRVLTGTSAPAVAPNVGDPYLYPLWWTKRGNSYRIDTSRYRILTAELGLAGDRDINAGSIARIVWKVAGETAENVSDDIILRHRQGANVLDTINLDLKNLPLDPLDFGSKTGWNGLVDNFRVDPHEFSAPRQFWVRSVKLTALERADSSYNIGWNYVFQGTAAVSMSLYFDQTGTGFSGTLIASGLNPATGSYAWTTSALPAGSYYIYAVLYQGAIAVNQAYAPWPVVIEHVIVPTATISLSRSTLYFGATQSGTVVTPAQNVELGVNGTGTVTWTASSNRSWLTVTPTSGTGPTRLSVQVNSSALPSPASMDGTITVTATGATNSPQYIRMFLNSMANGTTQAPFGLFETPANNSSNLAGNVPVTGWALDDIGVTTVQIWRSKVGSEAVAPNGLVFIGDAVFVPDARPDVAAAYPDRPRNYRGGWGYMLLTNFLPNPSGPMGNGTYTLHAIATDVEGKTTTLGTKLISVDNAHAVKPFGTLDTPGQGETVSGASYVDFGWALTPPPQAIATDGSTLAVYLDGAMIGRPTYNQYRSDIATLFPDCLNHNGGVGYFYIDTTQLANGMHSIAWSVTDNAGRADGIGSRYFFISNGVNGPNPAALPEPSSALARAARPASWHAARPSPNPATTEPLYRTGYSDATPLLPVPPSPDGTPAVIEVSDLERIEIHLPASRRFSAWRARSPGVTATNQLPVGSSLDPEEGVFTWQLGPGFSGLHTLLFESGADSEPIQIQVRVVPVNSAPAGAAPDGN
ncbi:MAG: hypothetical protein HY821_08990 [Acidobacteria bacterium]|nr:hypothetical protein [Acidobacteriota bacterium]